MLNFKDVYSQQIKGYADCADFFSRIDVSSPKPNILFNTFEKLYFFLVRSEALDNQSRANAGRKRILDDEWDNLFLIS